MMMNPRAVVRRSTLALAALFVLLFFSACSPSSTGGEPTEVLLTEQSQPGGASAGQTTPTASLLLPPSEQATLALTGTPSASEVSAPILASNVFKAEVLGQDGNPLGTPAGVIADVLSGRAEYLVLETNALPESKRVLLPWGTFQLALKLAPNSSGNQSTPLPVLHVNSSAADLSGAPVFDENVFASGKPLAVNWDQSAREYWAGKLENIPVTGTRAETAGALIDLRGPEAFKERAYPVQDAQGQPVGDIRDLIIQPDGTLAFGLLQADAALGLGDTRLPVAWKALAWDAGQARFVLNAPVEVLRAVPPFDTQRLPDMSVPGWEQDWQRYWEQALASNPAGAVATPAAVAQPAAPSAPHLVSTLMGTPISDRAGQPVGDLAELLLDTNGVTHYAVLRVGQKFIPVPWGGLAWQPLAAGANVTASAGATAAGANTPGLMFNLDPAVLSKAPTFDRLEQISGQTDWYEQAVTYWSSFVMQATPVADTPTPESQQPLLGALELIHSNAVHPTRIAIGPVSDLLLGLDGISPYLIVKVGEQFRPVPWVMFEYNFENVTLAYLDDPQRLNDSPGFAALKNIELGAANWDQKIRTHWGMK